MTDNSLSEITKGVSFFQPPPDRIAGWRRSANIVMLDGNREIFLIDTGGPSIRKQLVGIVRNQLEGPRDQIHCVHTHGHIDHIAGTPVLKDHLSAESWAAENAIPFVEKQSPIFFERERESIVVFLHELFTAPSWFVRAAMRVTLGKTKPLDSVRNILDMPTLKETGFIPISLPGHHAGHTGFLNKENGILIGGDLIDPRHRMKPLLTAPSSDFQMMKESLEKLRGLGVTILLPGHGNPIAGEEKVQAALDQALQTLSNAREAVISILETLPTSLPDLSSQLIRLGLGPGDVFRRMFIHCILRHLMESGKVGKQQTRRKTVFSI
ncbi:MAG: MBL fold metallo-hydrolase [Candidatus Thorarchaeota archaeon]